MKRLTDAAIRAAKPQDGFYDLSDAGSPLFLRVKKSGQKLWFARIRVHGKQTKVAIGEYPDVRLDDARFEAAKLKREARETSKLEKPAPRIHPHHLPAPELTVSNALDRYYDMKLKNLASGEQARAMITTYFLPEFGKRDLASLTKREIITHFEKLYTDGFKGAGLNRVLANTKAFLNWFAKRGEIDVNPAAGIERLVKEKPRDRLLIDHELAAILHSVPDLYGNYGSPIALLLYTATRRSDIFNLTWGEVVERGDDIELHIEMTKAGVPHIAWLAPQARKFIPERPENAKPTDKVFKGLSAGGRIYDKMRDEVDLHAGGKLDDWGLHDFRTACVSHINDIRGRDEFHVSSEAMDMLLAHVPRPALVIVSKMRVGILGCLGSSAWISSRRFFEVISSFSLRASAIFALCRSIASSYFLIAISYSARSLVSKSLTALISGLKISLFMPPDGTRHIA